MFRLYLHDIAIKPTCLKPNPMLKGMTIIYHYYSNYHPMNHVTPWNSLHVEGNFGRGFFGPKITGTAAPVVPQPLVQQATAQIGQRAQSAAAQLLDEETEDQGTLDLGRILKKVI